MNSLGTPGAGMQGMMGGTGFPPMNAAMSAQVETEMSMETDICQTASSCDDT